MLFLESMYLQLAFLWACRYFSSCLSCTIASASCLFWDLKILPLQILHLHLTFSITWRCSPVKLRICILPFLGFEDTPFANFASTSHIFDNVKMLPIKILHLQSPRIHYRRYCRSISFEFYLLHNLSQYITYQKIDIRNSSEYGVSVGDT